MRAFVTGATGFIGGHLTEQLVKAGHDVVALVRDPVADAAAGLEAMGVELAVGDITERGTLDAPMQDVDALFHLAAWYKVGARDRHRAEAVNVGGTRNVLEAMREHEVPRGIYTSTLAVNSDTDGEVRDESYRFDGRHLSAYDRTKWFAHHEVAVPMVEAGLPLTLVMPGVVYGPGDPSAMGSLLRNYLRGKLAAVPPTAYCWAHVEDTARAHLLALEHGEPGETYMVCGEPRTLPDVLALAEEMTGIPAPRTAPAWVLRALSALMRPVAAVSNVAGSYHPETLRVAAGATYLGTNAKARRALGFDPRALEAGLRETLQHEMAQLEIEPRTGGG